MKGCSYCRMEKEFIVPLAALAGLALMLIISRWRCGPNHLKSTIRAIDNALFGQSHPQLSKIASVSPLVVRVLGLNPGSFTLQGTNTYLVGHGKSRILVDSGEGIPAYVPLLKQAMQEEGVEHISDILLTHHHFDHVGGVADIVKLFAENAETVPRVWKMMKESDNAIINGVSVTNLRDGQIFQTRGATLRAVYTPGHTDDHTSFLLEEESALFSGDCILGHGTAVFQDLHTYMSSLKLLLDLSPKRIYPGHGDVIVDGQGKIKDYIKHRELREGQIVNVLREVKELGLTSITPSDIVAKIYPPLSLAVRRAAVKNTKLHLGKLQKDGLAQLVEAGGSFSEESWAIYV